MALLSGIGVDAPGTYVFPTTSGVRPADIQPFNSCYMVGFSPTGVKNTPTRVLNSADYLNLFGAGEDGKYVDLFFLNSGSYGNLYYINTAIAPRYSITVAAVVTVGAHPFIINGMEITATAVGTETPTEFAADFISAINLDVVLSKEVIASVGEVAGQFVIRSLNPIDELLVTGSDAVLTIASSAPLIPDTIDVVYAITNSFDPMLSPGFLIAPGIFSSTFNASARLSIANSMEALASGNKFQWMALVDCGNLTDVPNVSRAILEGSTYTTAQGHLAYYFPGGTDNSDRHIVPSPGIAGLAIKRYLEQGFSEPPAGAEYPLKGIKTLDYSATWNDSNVANKEGINLLVNQPNRGIVCWGARTRSIDPLFRFVNTRVILNIVISTLARAFDYELFNSIGGASDILFDIQRKGNALLDVLWRAGLFYGASPDVAFTFISDITVQLPTLLEAGIANAFCWVVPATTLERLIITISRVAVGELSYAVSSDTSFITAQKVAADATAQDTKKTTTQATPAKATT